MIDPCDYGFKATFTSDGTIYHRKIRGGTLFLEIFPSYWVEYVSESGRLMSFTEKDCRPLSTLPAFLQVASQVFKEVAHAST